MQRLPLARETLPWLHQHTKTVHHSTCPQSVSPHGTQYKWANPIPCGDPFVLLKCNKLLQTNDPTLFYHTHRHTCVNRTRPMVTIQQKIGQNRVSWLAARGTVHVANHSRTICHTPDPLEQQLVNLTAWILCLCRTWQRVSMLRARAQRAFFVSKKTQKFTFSIHLDWSFFVVLLPPPPSNMVLLLLLAGLMRFCHSRSNASSSCTWCNSLVVVACCCAWLRFSFTTLMCWLLSSVRWMDKTCLPVESCTCVLVSAMLLPLCDCILVEEDWYKNVLLLPRCMLAPNMFLAMLANCLSNTSKESVKNASCKDIMLVLLCLWFGIYSSCSSSDDAGSSTR